VLGKGDEVVTR